MSKQAIKAVIHQHQTGTQVGKPHSENVLKPHFPVNKGHQHYQSSGVTIGVGIDLGKRTPHEIKQLFEGNVSPQQLDLLKTASGLKGKQAQDWVKKHKNQIKLSQAALEKIFDKVFDQKDKTMNRIVSSDDFRKKYGVDGKKLLDEMSPEYKMAMYDLLYLGRNNVQTRQKIIPLLVKVHQKKASPADIAKLNTTIVDLYKGHKERSKNMERILNSGNQTPKQNISQLQKMNKQFNEIVNNTSLKQINNLIHGKIGGVDLGCDLSSMKINGFELASNLIKMHIQEAENPYVRDLIVPLKIYYDQSIQYKNISISIDPLDPYNPDGPLYQKIYYPKQMEGTYFAEMMVSADYLMKLLILGLDDQGQPFKYPQSLKKVGFALEDQIQYMDRLAQRTRQWIVIKKVHFIQDDTNCIKIGDIQMGLQARVQEVGSEGRLADAQRETGTRIKRFCQLFTKHYNLLEEEYQVFKIVKRLAKASVIAKLMVQKRCNINFKLINQLFELQKTDKSPKTVQKLSNKLRLTHEQIPLMQCESSKTILLSLTGGCDLNFRQEMRTMDSQKTLSFESEKDYLPFFFQSYIKCEEQSCQNICDNGFQSITDTKCKDHTINICQLCWQLFRQNDKFVRLNDGRLVHNECLHCQACYGYITGPYVEYQMLFYHQSCSPPVIVGSCYVCRNNITTNQDYLSGGKGLIHSYCAENFKCEGCNKSQSLKNLININEKYYHPHCIRCSFCRNIITEESFKVTSNGFAHESCIPKIVCKACQQIIVGNYQKLGDSQYHQSCLVCFKCKQPLTNQILADQKGNFYHPGCS